MAGIRKPHTAWSACLVCILSVFLSFHNPTFAEIKSVLLNPTENGKYTVVEISGEQNITYFPHSINNLGQVVGYSTTKGGYYQAFFWTESAGVNDLGALGSDPASIAYEINDIGQIVGESFPQPYNLGRAFLETESDGMVQLATPAGAISINNSGVVCGTGQHAGYSGMQPFVWSVSQGIYFIGNLGGNGYFNVARHINNSNQIVGGSSNSDDNFTHAYLWSKSKGMQDLGTLPDDEASMAECVNDSGQVVGWSRNFRSAGTQDRAFIWSAQNGMTKLPSLCRFANANAFGINNSGIAVGTSRPLQAEGNWLQHAVIWQNGNAIDLNELVEGQSLDYKLTCAMAINDQGQIIAVSDSCYNVPDYPEPIITPSPITITKCSILAGNENMDSISISGLFDADDSDFLVAMGGNAEIAINCDTMPYPKTFEFPIDDTAYKGGKFSSKDTNASFNFGAKSHKFTFTAKKTDLTGLACPFILTIIIGDYSAQVQLDEEIVNGSKKDCPFQLMMGVQDNLEATKYKLKPGKTAETDTFTAQGIFTIDGELNLLKPLVIRISSQNFTVPYDSFTNKKGVYSCKNAPAAEGGLVTAKLDYNKCTFTLAVTKASIEDIGIVKFEIDCFGNSLKGLETITLN